MCKSAATKAECNANMYTGSMKYPRVGKMIKPDGRRFDLSYRRFLSESECVAYCFVTPRCLGIHYYTDATWKELCDLHFGS